MTINSKNNKTIQIKLSVLKFFQLGLIIQVHLNKLECRGEVHLFQ